MKDWVTLFLGSYLVLFGVNTLRLLLMPEPPLVNSLVSFRRLGNLNNLVRARLKANVEIINECIAMVFVKTSSIYG